MLNKPLQGIALAACVALMATKAAAQLVTVSQIPGYSPEFNVNPVVGNGYDPLKTIVLGGYETFCVSRNLSIGALPGTYNYSVATNGVYIKSLTLDINQVPVPSTYGTISKGSAWLYAQFAKGTLTGYGYDGFATPSLNNSSISQRESDALDLQAAIWYLEGTYTFPGGDPFINPYLVQAANAFGGGSGGLANAMLPYNPGDYGVGILTLTFSGGQNPGSPAQPLLVLLPCTTPDATIAAPVSVTPGSTNNAASVSLLGAGATYAWTISNGTITAGQGTASITWTAGATGTTTLGVNVTNAGGCYAFGSDLVTVVCVAPDVTITVPVAVYGGSSNIAASVTSAGTGATYAWTISNGTITSGQGTPNITWTAGATGTTYLGVTVNKADGCSAVGLKAVTLLCTTPSALITAPISVNTGTTNNSASVPVAGAGETYVWTITNGTITSGQGTPSITWTAGATGTTTLGVTVTVVGGCSATNSKLVTVACVTPGATITAPVNVFSGATNNTASVPNAGTGSTYVWTITNGTITSGQGAPSITWTAGTSGTTTLGVTVTVAGGCSATGSKLVTVACVTPGATITTPLTVSGGSTNSASVPSAGTGATYVWTISNGTIVSGQGTTTIKWVAGAGGTTTLGVTVTVVGGCSATASASVCVTCVTPNATITAPVSVSPGATNNTASVASAGAGATYVWTISNGTITSGQGTATIKWTAGASGSTTLSVKVTSAGGCYDTGCKTICIICVTPNATISAPSSVVAGSANNTASVANAGSGATYVWCISNGTITSGQGTSSIQFTAGLCGTTTVSVKVTSAGGCSDTDSNCISLTSGYTTYTIGTWGACPNGSNVASALAKAFASVYPSGVVVGGTYTIKLTSQPAVQNFLANGGTPGVLTKCYVNPTTTESKIFGAQVTVLKLNLDASALGFIKNGLANLKVASGNKLAGYTVAQVATLANKVLGGTTSALPGGVSVADLNNVVTAINGNFDNGTTNNGFLVP